MPTERYPLLSDYPDPSFALDLICPDDSPSSSDPADPPLVLNRVAADLSRSNSDYPDPSLGLVPVEEPVEEEEMAFA